MPLGAVPFGQPNFDSLKITINDSVIMWGSFVTAAVSFVLTALAVLLFIVKPYDAFADRGKNNDAEPESAPSEIDLLIEIRNSLRTRPG